jgi:hypothetical protein
MFTEVQPISITLWVYSLQDNFPRLSSTLQGGLRILVYRKLTVLPTLPKEE